MGQHWALILGASSGFGEATALALAKSGYGIVGVHFDRKATLHNVDRIRAELRDMGAKEEFFNINAADPVKRAEVLDEILSIAGAKSIRVLMHSLAFGGLAPIVPTEDLAALTQKQMEMTMDVMANSLIYWVQDMIARDLFGPHSRIFGMTSSGSTRAIRTYGAVSAAKCALEAHIRQLAVELAPLGITANAIRAGVTDTPALRKIPVHKELIESALEHNPSKRLTTPEDVAKAIAVLSHPDLDWMTGNVINIDGGEEVTA